MKATTKLLKQRLKELDNEVPSSNLTSEPKSESKESFNPEQFARDMDATIPPLIQGRIKELRVDWGFIEGEDGKDYFLYCKSMNKDSCSFRSLKVNDVVCFFPTSNNKGPRAEMVTRLGS